MEVLWDLMDFSGNILYFVFSRTSCCTSEDVWDLLLWHFMFQKTIKFIGVFSP